MHSSFTFQISENSKKKIIVAEENRLRQVRYQEIPIQCSQNPEQPKYNFHCISALYIPNYWQRDKKT
jgi:hypothetical protein